MIPHHELLPDTRGGNIFPAVNARTLRRVQREARALTAGKMLPPRVSSEINIELCPRRYPRGLFPRHFLF